MQFNTFAEAARHARPRSRYRHRRDRRPAAEQAIEEGADLAVSSWDILSGDVKPAEDVLLFDDNGAHPGMAAAEFIAERGARSSS